MVDPRGAPQIGPLIAETTAPEADKFTAALLLVHGLWEEPAVWRRSAGYWAHRGWRCIAVGRRPTAATLAAHVDDLRAAIAALPAPPVIIGHDVGALLALRCADAARAVAALAPLVGPPLAPPPPALQRAGTWLARRRGLPLRPPGGRWRDAYPRRDLREPARLIDELITAAPWPTATPSAPCGMFALAGDAVTPLASAAAVAQRLGAELETVPGTSHAALGGPGWEERVAAIHRWIIRRLGVDLLSLYDEAMRGE